MRRNSSISTGALFFGAIFVFCAVSAQSQPVPRAQQTRYFHFDELGNLIATTDEAGEVMWEHRPEPFGTGQSTERAPLYVGAERQPGTDENGGVYIFGHRAMVPDVGRFTSPDLKSFTAYVGDPEAENQYSYAANNPIHYQDVTGLSPDPVMNLSHGRAFVKYLNQYSKGTSTDDAFRRYWAIRSLTTFGGLFPADNPENRFALTALTQPGMWATKEMSSSLGGNATAHKNQVDFDWGVRVVSATHFQHDLNRMKGEAAAKFFMAKTGWNTASAIAHPVYLLYKYFKDEKPEAYTPSFDADRDENFLGAMILIDWIHHGGDFTRYFDAESQQDLAK